MKQQPYSMEVGKMRKVIWLGPVRGQLTSAPVGFNGGRRLPVEVKADEMGYTLIAEVPGFGPDQVQVRWEDESLVVSAGPSKEQGEEADEAPYDRGSVVRRLRLPADADPNGIEAWVEHGLLTVQVPKQESARPRQIEVKAR
jgi:HSP20 family protein